MVVVVVTVVVIHYIPVKDKSFDKVLEHLPEIGSQTPLLFLTGKQLVV